MKKALAIIGLVVLGVAATLGVQGAAKMWKNRKSSK